MNKGDAVRQRVLWLSRPLCRRYGAGFFSTSAMLVGSAIESREQRFSWALGCLRDGDCEVLGVWHHEETEATVPAEVFSDLAVRGVEKLQLVFSTGPELPRGAERDRRGDARADPSIKQVQSDAVAEMSPRQRIPVVDTQRAAAKARTVKEVCDALTAFEHGRCGEEYREIATGRQVASPEWCERLELSPSRRRMLLSCDRKAAKLHHGLILAIARHGHFVDEAAALDFVADALTRAERRLDRERVAGLPRVRSPRAGLVGPAVPDLLAVPVDSRRPT